jgi:hypothetical protein
VSGLWFRSGNVVSLADALEKIKDDTLTQRLSENAYLSYWRHPPTLERHIAEILSVYRAALSRNAGRSESRCA